MVLVLDEVYLAYELCAYEKYLYDRVSFWCDLLTDEDRMVLEYGQDLEVNSPIFTITI